MPLRTLDAELFCRSESLLGEGPFWHENRLYWVDILQSKLQSCDATGQDCRAAVLPSHVGAVAPWQGGFIAGTQQGIGILTKAIELQPKYAQAYFFRCAVKQATGDETGAIADGKRALEIGLPEPMRKNMQEMLRKLEER